LAPQYSKELYTNGSETQLIAWFSAGAFVLLGFPISMYGIFGHLSHYYQPEVQCFVVRILWMVPIYSIGSWFSLRFHEQSLYIETFRDCYESYVIYCFYYYLVSVLGGENELIMILKDKSVTRGVHLRGVRCFVSPWLMGQPVQVYQPGSNYVKWTSPFLTNCKFGVLQYVLLKFIVAFVSVVLQMNGLYTEGDWSLTGSFFWLTSVIFWSQCWALYCLAFFYFATKVSAFAKRSVHMTLIWTVPEQPPSTKRYAWSNQSTCFIFSVFKPPYV